MITPFQQKRVVDFLFCCDTDNTQLVFLVFGLSSYDKIFMSGCSGYYNYETIFRQLGDLKNISVDCAKYFFQSEMIFLPRHTVRLICLDESKDTHKAAYILKSMYLFLVQLLSDVV